VRPLARQLCELAYQPPFVVSPDYRTATAVKAFGGDHRDMLLHLPRVRMDGLYISVVHCLSRPRSWLNFSHGREALTHCSFSADVRVGSSETLWNDPVHMSQPRLCVPHSPEAAT
jgi:hypothetical protein